MNKFYVRPSRASEDALTTTVGNSGKSSDLIDTSFGYPLSKTKYYKKSSLLYSLATILLPLLLLLGSGSLLQAQQPTYGWTAAGTTTANNSNFIGGSRVTTDNLGNVYTIGQFWGTVDFDPGAGVSTLTSAGGYDIFIQKLNKSGGLVWIKQVGGNGSGTDFGYGIVLDASGNIYTTGNFSGTVDFDPGAGVANLTATALSDIFVQKLDASGNYVWAKSIKGNGGASNLAYSIAVDGNSNVYFTGSFRGGVDFDPGPGVVGLFAGGTYDIFIEKLDASGNYVWVRQMMGEAFTASYGYGLAVDANSNVYTIGHFQGTIDFDPGAGVVNRSSAGSNDIFIQKLDASGDYVWAKTFGSMGSEYGFGIALDGSNNVYTTGSFMGTIDFDPGTGVANLTSVSGGDVFIEKLDASGNYIWAKSMGSVIDDYGTCISVDGGGNVYTAGSFSANADFDPGAGVANLTNLGDWDAFIQILDPSGNYTWAGRMGGVNRDRVNSIAVNSKGEIFSTGFFQGTSNMNPVGSTDTKTGNSVGIFTQKLIGIPFNVTFNKTDATCANSTDGGLRAIGSGCSANPATYNYLWTPGNYTTDTISNLAPGTYNVRVICGTDTINKSVIVAATTSVATPVTSNQSFCSGATVADLIATPSSGNTIKWFTTAIGGTALPNSTLLVNGKKYYAAEVTPANCESNIRAVDSVTLFASVEAKGDSSYCNGSNISVNFVGAAGNTYTWTATQNGTGIAASGTGNFNFTGVNNTDAVITDSVMVSSSNTPPVGYTISDGVYAFADTTGSTYLDLASEYAGSNALSGQKSIGFNFDYYRTSYSNFYIGRYGAISFSSNLGDQKIIYGQNRDNWIFDASTKIAYKTTGTAPNRKLIISFINLKKPNDTSTTSQCGPNPSQTLTTNIALTADPSAGYGVFQIILNETSNVIESAKQSVPSVIVNRTFVSSGCFFPPPPSFTGPLGANRELLVHGPFTVIAVPGRNNGDWIKLDNESKIFTPNSSVGCPPQRDTFAISVLPQPKVDSIANAQICPGGTSAGINFTTPTTGGTVEYKWTNSNTGIGLAASGTGNIPSFTASSTAQTSTITVTPYMVRSATDTCFGSPSSFAIIADLPPAPTTTGNLVVYTGSKTVSQLAVTPLTGGTVNYYYDATGGSALEGSTTVVDDTTYYITQTINGCESAPRKSIKVNRIANDSSVNCAASIVANLVATPVSGNVVKWFDVPTGGTALAGTVALQSGEDTLYVEEGGIKTDTLLTRVGSYVDYIISLTHDENDTLYYGTYGSNNVYRANPNGSSPTLFFNGGGSIRSLTYRKEGSDRFLYYLNDGTSINKRNLANGATTSIGSGLFWPSQIAFDDANGVIYVADRENSKLKKIVVATNTVSTVDSFITTPFVDYNRIMGVAYNPATNTIFFNNFDKGKVYSKNLSGNNPRVQILAISAPQSISLLPNGKLLIAVGSGIVTCNQDGSSLVTLKSGLYGTNEPFFNNNGELTFTNLNSVAKESNNKSNRVPVTVIVNPVPNVISTDDQVACDNGNVAAINFGTTTTGGTVTYDWTNSNPNIGLASSGSGTIPAFTAINTGTAPDTATIIVTPSYAFGGKNCTGTEDTFYIIVNPVATINSITNKVSCDGSSVAQVNPTSSTMGGSISYTWSNDNTSIGLHAGGTGVIPSFIATNTTNAPIVATVTVTPIYTNQGKSCTGTPYSYTITVNPRPVVNAITNQSACNGATTTVIPFSTALTGGTVTYSWTNSDTTIGLAASGSGSLPSFSATNASNSPVTATISVTMTYTNEEVTCTSAARTFVYTVNPSASVNTINNQSVCNGSSTAAVNFSSSTTGGTISYSWTNSNPSIGLAASGSGNVPSFNAVNTSNDTVSATITVTPIFSNGAQSCTGTAKSFVITVNPSAVVNAVNDQIVCAGATNSSVSFSSPVTGNTYAWVNNRPGIGLAASGTGSVPSFVSTNNTTSAITATITVTPTSAAGCVGQPITYTITVNGLSVAPTSISNPTPIVCANDAFVTLTVNGGALGTDAVWKWYADSVNTTSIGTGLTLSNIPVQKTTTYFVRAEGTCNNTAAASVVVQKADLVHQVRQHWSDVLLFDNSSKNYVAWQWYKNGIAVPGATLQQYSETGSLVGSYYVVATDKNGLQSVSCPLTIAAGSFSGLRISLAPNPVTIGTNLTISTSFTANELQGANITITDIFGRTIRQLTTVTPTTNTQAPTAIGMYIVTLTMKNGVKYSANLLTK